jgi:hypothetical protein
VVHHGAVYEQGREPERGDDAVVRDEFAANIRRYLDAGLEVLTDLGAHGEVALGFALPAGRSFHWPNWYDELGGDVLVRRWISLDIDEADRDALVEGIVAEVG